MPWLWNQLVSKFKALPRGNGVQRLEETCWNSCLMSLTAALPNIAAGQAHVGHDAASHEAGPLAHPGWPAVPYVDASEIKSHSGHIKLLQTLCTCRSDPRSCCIQMSSASSFLQLLAFTPPGWAKGLQTVSSAGERQPPRNRAARAARGAVRMQRSRRPCICT